MLFSAAMGIPLTSLHIQHTSDASGQIQHVVHTNGAVGIPQVSTLNGMNTGTMQQLAAILGGHTLNLANGAGANENGEAEKDDLVDGESWPSMLQPLMMCKGDDMQLSVPEMTKVTIMQHSDGQGSGDGRAVIVPHDGSWVSIVPVSTEKDSCDGVHGEQGKGMLCVYENDEGEPVIQFETGRTFDGTTYAKIFDREDCWDPTANDFFESEEEDEEGGEKEEGGEEEDHGDGEEEGEHGDGEDEHKEEGEDKEEGEGKEDKAD